MTKMKLTKNTIEVLQNFATINSNILVSPGNTLKTISSVKNIMAESKVDCQFDTSFGIWDLQQFLATVSLFEDPSLEFAEKYVTITGEKSNKSSIKYYYCEPKLLTTVTKEIRLPEIVIEFDLPNETLQEILKAAKVLQLTDVCIRSNEDRIEILVTNKHDATSNHVVIEVGTLTENANFEFFIKTDNLKMIPGNYTVALTEKIVSNFTNKDRDIEYWIALDSDSTYTKGN